MTEYPVVVKACVREVGVEESLQAGYADVVLPVDEGDRTGREADVVTVVHNGPIGVPTGACHEQCQEKD
jgi:hypothetical protein